MIEKVEIKNFRGIQRLKIEGLSKINIFVGQANTSKTSILEALYLALSQNHKALIDILKSRYMISDLDAFQSLFFDYDLASKISVESNLGSMVIDCPKDKSFSTISTISDYNNKITDGINQITLQYKSYHQSEDKDTVINIQRMFLSEDRIHFEVATQNDKQTPSIADFICDTLKDSLINNLKKIFNEKNLREKLKSKCRDFSQNIEEILFSADSKIMVQQASLNNLINLKSMGEGFKKYLHIVASLLVDKRYIMIDEIENGLHFSGISKLFEIFTQEQNEAQFFITTHSLEILKTIAQIANQQEESFALFNVYQDSNGRLAVARFSQEDFLKNIENENELRD